MLMDLLAKNNAKGLSMDTCKQRGITEDDMEYVANRLNRYQQQNGSLKVALTVPANMDKSAADEFIQIIKNNKVEVKSCQKTEDVHSWLSMPMQEAV